MATGVSERRMRGDEPSSSTHGDDGAIPLDELFAHAAGHRRSLVFALCALILAIEGFDMYMIGGLVTALAAHFGAPPARVTGLFVAQSAGLVVGYAAIAPLADRIGRRPVIVGCVAAFALLTLACVTAATLSQLVALRFLAFACFSGAMTNAIALLSEIASPSRRQRSIVAVNGAIALGGAAGSLIAPPLLRAHGWSAPFWAGGLAPLVLLPVLVAVLPESPRYLIAAAAAPARLARALRLLGIADAERRASQVTDTRPAQRPSLRELFGEGRLLPTLLFVIVGGATLLVINLVSSWLPTLLQMHSGYGAVEAARFLAWSSLGSILWPVTLMVLLVRAVGVKRSVVVSYLLGAASLASFAASPLSPLAATLLAMGFGAFVVGAIGGVNALVVAVYPTAIRARALGWTASAGRLFAIAGPALGGLLVARSASPTLVAVALTVPLLVAAGCTLLIPVSSRIN